MGRERRAVGDGSPNYPGVLHKQFCAYPLKEIADTAINIFPYFLGKCESSDQRSPGCDGLQAWEWLGDSSYCEL